MLRHLYGRFIKKLLRKFQKPPHFYPTRFSELNYVQQVHSIKTRKYSISVRRPYIWNSFLSPEEKQYYA